MHNVMLAGMNEEIPVEDFELSVKSLMVEPSAEEKFIQSVELKNFVNDVVANFDLNCTVTYETLPDCVMALYSEVFESNINDCEDIVTLINQYSDIVMSSNELSEREKQWIQMGLAVSLYSYNYWNKKGSIN